MYVAKNTALHLTDLLGHAALPAEIDLGDSQAPMLLASLDAHWTAMQPRMRAAAIRDLRLTLPMPELHGHGPVVLPGGAVALRAGAEGVLVCDPLAAAALTEAPAAALRAALAAAPGVQTLSHAAAGLVLTPGIPAELPLQSCSLLTDAEALAAILPAAAGWGRVLVQWRPGGAVAWPLVEAPAPLALAASLAGIAVEPGTPPVPSASWDAPDAAARIERLAPAVFECVNDLLTDEVSDELRWALAGKAVHGEADVAGRLATALLLLPAAFGTDPQADAGRQLLATWAQAEPHLAGAPAGLVMLGIEAGASGAAALQALRDVLDGEGLFFAERAAPGHHGTPIVALGSQGARYAAHRLTERDRCGVLIAPPAGPVELFALAAALAERISGQVVVAAPSWNFYHRIDARDGSEAGNATWFGMGAGLDELDWL